MDYPESGWEDIPLEYITDPPGPEHSNHILSDHY